jgi:O-antigen/teichoic acid export membrane protein
VSRERWQQPISEQTGKYMSADAAPAAPPRPLTGGIVMTAASRVGVTGIGAATTIVLARVLGAKDWGSYFLAQSLFAILVAGTTLGIEHGIAYFVSSGKWGARAALQSAVTMAAAMGALGAGVALVVRLLVPSAFAGLPVWLIGVVAAGLPFALAWLYTSYVALATDGYEASMLMPVAQAALLLALAVPGAILFNRAGAVIGMTLATGVVGCGAVLWGRWRLPRNETAEIGQLRRAVAFGVKGYAANALQLVNYRLDLFILSAVASTASVGRYSLAVAATSLLWVLPGALSSVLFPRVARLSHGGDVGAREMVERKSLAHASMIVVTSSLLLAAGLELLVVPVFGETFRPTINLGLILLPGAAAIAIGMVLAATIVGRGKPIYSLYGALITTPLTIAFYFSLIPLLHATGAALASSVSYGVGLLIGCHYYRRVTGRRVLPSLMPTRSELADLRGLAQAMATRVGLLPR